MSISEVGERKTWMGPTEQRFIPLAQCVIPTFYSISGRAQFLSVADLLNVSVSEVGERKTWMEAHCATLYTSKFSTLLKTAVDSM